jgi:hypothetical protein
MPSSTFCSLFQALMTFSDLQCLSHSLHSFHSFRDFPFLFSIVFGDEEQIGNGGRMDDEE